MNLNFDDLYQIEGGSSEKKIYRYKNDKEKNIVVDFAYESAVLPEQMFSPIPRWIGYKQTKNVPSLE